MSTMLSASGDPKIPSQLIDIYNTARVYNSEHHITGVFVVADNILLQVLEGDAKDLAGLMYRIGRDERTTNVSVVLNSQIDKSAFSRWSIKFIRPGSDAHHGFMSNLQGILGDQILAKTAQDKERLDVFFQDSVKYQPKLIDINNEITTSAADDNRKYHHHVISISTWPTFNQLKPTAELIKLCSRLVGRPTPFQNLLDQNIFASEEQLKSVLDKLDDLGLIKRHAKAENSQLRLVKGEPVKPQNTTAGDRFSQVLRKFLTASKH